jgi:membrane associated rhomboid family serine protease
MSALPTCYRHPDRETGLSCSECGRPICTDCVTYAPVGLRCPDHSGKPQGKAKVAAAVGARGDDLVTRALIAVNVAIFLAEIATGASFTNFGTSSVIDKLALFPPSVAQGDWWRLATSGFLHYGFIHLGMNMYALFLLGGSLERVMGRGRFVLVYATSLLAGSAGAVLLSPCSLTAGASGAIFGLFGAALVLERQRVIAAQGLMGIIVINLVFTLAVPGISIGGHLGGFVGGALTALALSRFGRGHALYGRIGLIEAVGSLAVGAVAIGLAEWGAHQAHCLFLPPL